VTSDPQVAGWLARRGLSPNLVEERDLARALRGGATWMFCRRRDREDLGASWSSAGYRVVLPLYGASGALESLHARNLDATAEPKAVSPARASVAGLVMADPSAVAMLRREYVPAQLVIAEGVPDFLTWATRWSDADEDAPAVLGVIAGSWTDELAGRISSGLCVVVRTHRDEAGAKYADRICASLAARCSVYRFPEPTP
jgi:hypothetical protein